LSNLHSIFDIIIPNNVTRIEKLVFYSCSGFDGILQLPNDLTYIGDYAFNNNNKLTGNLILPESLTYLGNYVFRYCYSFTGSLIIPESTTTIGYSAFLNLSGFTGNLIIPGSVREIGSNAFEGFQRITGTLSLSDGLEIIGSRAFSYSLFTGSLLIPSSVTTIKFSAFYGCHSLTGDLYIPDSVTNIQDSAFRNCYGLNGTLTISKNIKVISDYTFYYCNGLTGDIIIPSNIVSIGRSAFGGCSNFQGFLSIPDSLEEIKERAFQNCYLLSGELTLPSQLEYIGSKTFSYCYSLSSRLIIPNKVKSIGGNAFYNCKSFTGKLLIPFSVDNIDSYAFKYCIGITYIEYYSSTIVEEDSFADDVKPVILPDWFYNYIHDTLLGQDNVVIISSFSILLFTCFGYYLIGFRKTKQEFIQFNNTRFQFLLCYIIFNSVSEYLILYYLLIKKYTWFTPLYPTQYTYNFGYIMSSARILNYLISLHFILLLYSNKLIYKTDYLIYIDRNSLKLYNHPEKKQRIMNLINLLFLLLDNFSIILIPWKQTEFVKLSYGFPNFHIYKLAMFIKCFNCIIGLFTSSFIFFNSYLFIMPYSIFYSCYFLLNIIMLLFVFRNIYIDIFNSKIEVSNKISMVLPEVDIKKERYLSIDYFKYSILFFI
jgi:hypothetical protein